MFKTIYAPLESIDDAKKNKNIGRTMITLLVSSILLAITALINFLKLGVEGKSLIYTVLGTLIGIFVTYLFLGWLFSLTMKVFAKKTTYYDTLTPVVQGLFILTTGALVAVILGFIPLGIGQVLGTLVTIVAIILSYSITIKSTMELTGTDIVTTVVGLLILFMSFVIAAYTTFVQAMIFSGRIF